jgi:hypothetical protein
LRQLSHAFELVRISDQVVFTCVATGPGAKRFWMNAISAAIKDNMRRAMSTRIAAADVSKESRLCEYCRTLPAAAKVVFVDTDKPIVRACQPCAFVLNQQASGGDAAVNLLGGGNARAVGRTRRGSDAGEGASPPLQANAASSNSQRQGALYRSVTSLAMGEGGSNSAGTALAGLGGAARNSGRQQRAGTNPPTMVPAATAMSPIAPPLVGSRSSSDLSTDDGGVSVALGADSPSLTDDDNERRLSRRTGSFGAAATSPPTPVVGHNRPGSFGAAGSAPPPLVAQSSTRTAAGTTATSGARGSNPPSPVYPRAPPRPHAMTNSSPAPIAPPR